MNIVRVRVGNEDYIIVDGNLIKLPLQPDFYVSDIEISATRHEFTMKSNLPSPNDISLEECVFEVLKNKLIPIVAKD